MKNMSFYKSILAAAVVLITAPSAFGQIGDMPFNDLPPQPTGFGKCYAKCKVPDKYEDLTRQVLTKEASSRKVASAAVYETASETVLVKEASTKLIPVPAVYETVSDQMLVKEASTRLKTVPAVYTTETEQILVSDGYGKWERKKKAPTCFSSNPDDCYVMCWVEVPAKYKTITKQVLVSPARTDVIDIPAEYKTVTRRVLVTPASTQTVEIPAEYKTISKKVLAVPASEDEIAIPAEYKTVTERRLVSQGGYTRWVEILCDSDTTPSVIRQVQQALKDRGYEPGPIDGILGSQTKSALRSYQGKNSLPEGNLNTETLRSLGL